MQVSSGVKRCTLESAGSNFLHDPAIAGLALNFRDVSERKALEEQLRQLAFHHPLTLLANGSLFRNRVEHALTLAQRLHQQIAVMFLDLVNFKSVNDSLGHEEFFLEFQPLIDLARAVVMLGDTLGLETVAEGIEQVDQMAALLQLGCVAGQGHALDDPLEATGRHPAGRIPAAPVGRLRLTAYAGGTVPPAGTVRKRSRCS